MTMIHKHQDPKDLRDRFALGLVKFLRILADAFFKKRYGHRAVVLETVAAVPGMVGAALLHFRCLRKIRDDQGWIEKLLAEANNERMHLMIFIEIAKPTWLERMAIVITQFLFVMAYFILYVFSSKTAHRFVGYLEEEAIISYTEYLEQVDQNPKKENIPATPLAIKYWNLSKNARLRELIIAVREDEILHRDTNHLIADKFSRHEDLLAPRSW
ncbi:MAG: alternative oxidase [Alphaproteobacteria bacterium]